MMARGGLLIGLLIASFGARADYQTLVIDTGPALNQSVLIQDQRLYIFSVTETDRNYTLGLAADSYKPKGETQPIRQDAIFFDGLETPGGPVAVLLTGSEARRLEDDSLILSFSSIYNRPVVDALPHYDAFRDLNGDGLDDFLMPSFRGFEIAIQRPNGTFTKPHTLEAPPIMDMSYNDHPWYQAKKLFLADMDLDGREDVVFWDEDHFIVYAQLGNGDFAEQAFMIPADVQLDYDSVDGMSVRLSNEDQSDKTVTVVYGINDYNGDGLADLMTMRVKSEGVLRKTTTFSLHPGRDDGNRHVAFSKQPVSGIESRGIQYEMEAQDLDADGDLDLIVSSVELGVGKIIAALLTSSIKIELGVYAMEKGVYPEKPDTTREITATFSLSSGEFWLPAVLIFDATGDGRADLLLQDDDELALFAGAANNDLFDSRSQRVETPMPRDPDLIETVDINGDGILDLMMRIPPPLDQKSRTHRVVLLLSK